ncbi:MAG: hypothetical protein GKR90_16205 [Pseudomonadales bacterium]|nr:hypothetical protein [Pseudomonadales bacterium]
MLSKSVCRQFACTILLTVSLSSAVIADTPTLSASPPTSDFVGEAFCFDAGLTNSGTPGFGPYHQIITQPDFTLSSADFLGLGLTPISVGTFALPSNQLIDPISGQTVTGPTGGELNVVRYPIGSVVAGQPSLDMTLCMDVDTNAVIDVLQSGAFEIVPVYEFGDTAVGTNGPTFGTRTGFDFTPMVIRYSISDVTAEMENPPGPAWVWNIDVFADIASNKTVTPVDFTADRASCECSIRRSCCILWHLHELPRYK